MVWHEADASSQRDDAERLHAAFAAGARPAPEQSRAELEQSWSRAEQSRAEVELSRGRARRATYPGRAGGETASDEASSSDDNATAVADDATAVMSDDDAAAASDDEAYAASDDGWTRFLCAARANVLRRGSRDLEMTWRVRMASLGNYE